MRWSYSNCSLCVHVSSFLLDDLDLPILKITSKSIRKLPIPLQLENAFFITYVTYGASGRDISHNRWSPLQAKGEEENENLDPETRSAIEAHKVLIGQAWQQAMRRQITVYHGVPTGVFPPMNSTMLARSSDLMDNGSTTAGETWSQVYRQLDQIPMFVYIADRLSS